LKDPDYTVNYHSGALGYVDESGEKVAIEARYANVFLRLPPERAAIIEALKL
jgi:hypothetical protein